LSAQDISTQDCRRFQLGRRLADFGNSWCSSQAMIPVIAFPIGKSLGNANA
jgi:hypothetical protein